MALSDDPLDVESIARAKRVQQRRDAAEIRRMRDDLRRVLSSEHGRRVLYRIVERAGVFRAVFSSDALVMAHNEGRRNEGLMLLADIEEAAPEQWESARREIAASRVAIKEDDDDDSE